MKKLISLAQVEQLIDELKITQWFSIASDVLKSKLSSLPTCSDDSPHGWIATESWEFPQRLDPEFVQCMSEYWPFLYEGIKNWVERQRKDEEYYS